MKEQNQNQTAAQGPKVNPIAAQGLKVKTSIKAGPMCPNCQGIRAR